MGTGTGTKQFFIHEVFPFFRTLAQDDENTFISEYRTSGMALCF
jgi:hypothetical protein